MMKVLMLVIAMSLLGGCNKYAMDIQMKNASPNLGHDVIAVCDTCQERSKCGGRDEALIWANDHARARGHRSFTRKACSEGLKPVAPYGAADDRRNNPELANLRENVLAVGMTVSEARKALNDTGVIESEAGRRQTIRFVQTMMNGGTKSTREVWGDFEDGKLVASRYGFWKSHESGE